jgi:hypothetical protein
MSAERARITLSAEEPRRSWQACRLILSFFIGVRQLLLLLFSRYFVCLRLAVPLHVTDDEGEVSAVPFSSVLGGGYSK